MTKEDFYEICEIIENEFDCIDDIDTGWVNGAPKDGYVHINCVNVDDRRDSSMLNNTRVIDQKLKEAGFNLSPLKFNRSDAFPNGCSCYSVDIEEL